VTPSSCASTSGIAVKKGNKELLDKINAGLKQIVADGTYAKIYKTWFDGEVTDPAAEVTPSRWPARPGRAPACRGSAGVPPRCLPACSAVRVPSSTPPFERTSS
jgi:hypothetical protein